MWGNERKNNILRTSDGVRSHGVIIGDTAVMNIPGYSRENHTQWQMIDTVTKTDKLIINFG